MQKSFLLSSKIAAWGYSSLFLHCVRIWLHWRHLHEYMEGYASSQKRNLAKILCNKCFPLSLIWLEILVYDHQIFCFEKLAVFYDLNLFLEWLQWFIENNLNIAYDQANLDQLTMLFFSHIPHLCYRHTPPKYQKSRDIELAPLILAFRTKAHSK